MNYPRGFIGILVLVFIAVLIGGGAYWGARKNTNPQWDLLKFIDNGSPQASLYHIPELGIKFSNTVPDLIHKVIKLPGDQAVNSVAFSNSRLEAAGCGLDTAPLGVLTYSDKSGTLVGQARGSDLYYLQPSGACRADASLQGWQELLIALESLTSIEEVTSATGTQQSRSVSDPISIDEKIAACYPKKEGCTACQPILNNSIQRVVETSRSFINVPVDFYPKDISSYFTTISGNATAGWVSNGGLPGEGLDGTPECWSTYFGFNGNGEIDLRVKSTKEGVPDYFVRFIVNPAR